MKDFILTVKHTHVLYLALHFTIHKSITVELVQDLMYMIVLINFHEDWMQNVACRVLTRQLLMMDARYRTDAAQNVITKAHLKHYVHR